MLLHRRFFSLLVLLLLQFSSSQKCAHYSHDELLTRLELHVTKCLGPSASISMLSTLTERFAANEFDRRQPLALVLFSNTSDLLQSLAGALASSLFGSSHTPHTVESVDFQALLENPRSSNHDIKHILRSTLVAPLDACPKRSLFILENVQALDDATLPVLDVLLDPLNGKRAQFQHYVEGQTSRVFDCTNTIFLFLYKISSQHFSTVNGKVDFSEWRELLMQRWTRIEGSIEEFTPQALVGRITDAVAVFPSGKNDNAGMRYDEFKKSREWRHMCVMRSHYTEDKADEIEDTDKIFPTSTLSLVAKNMAAASTIPGMIVMMSIPAYLLILTRAKRWNIETVKERRIIHRRRNSGGSIPKRKRRKTPTIVDLPMLQSEIVAVLQMLGRGRYIAVYPLRLLGLST
ncbi:hypothetical protein Plhal703r1_c17g0081421 [Plasmopara halstedii]